MGFYFAKPTTFKNPIIHVANIDYYAVDNTPSYLWESASRSISAALIVYLPTILEGYESWIKNPTIQKAINVDGGVVVKESVLTFQQRLPDYPHNFIKSKKAELLI
jgi:alanine dehydrogenase